MENNYVHELKMRTRYEKYFFFYLNLYYTPIFIHLEIDYNESKKVINSKINGTHFPK
jgi:hypothetical protein